ncbi:hypothetical protein [Clostridium baratii]|uniref:hypothetical protein n=1 Tax=Clostridium baratii TaxID=1561 RepID=UPI0030CF97DD
MKISLKNKFLKIGIALFIISSSSSLIHRSDFLLGFLFGISFGLMILGLLIENNIFQKINNC